VHTLGVLGLRLRRLPATIQVLVLGTFVNNLGMMITPYLTLVLAKRLFFSPAEIGNVFGVYGVGGLLAVVLGGRLSDALGRRMTLFLSMSGAGALAVSLPWVISFKAGFLIAVFFLGLLTESFRPVSSALIADFIAPDERQFAFSSMRVAAACGGLLGVSAGGTLFELKWAWIFYLDGATSLAFGLVALLFMRDCRPKENTKAIPDFDPRSSTRNILKNQYVAILLALFANLCLAFVYVTYSTVLPLAITSQGVYDGHMVGALLAINPLLILIAELPLIHHVSKYRRLKIAALGSALVGMGLGMSGLGKHWSWFALTISLWTLGEILALPQIMSFIMDQAPGNRRGTVIGFYSMTWRLAFIFGPMVLVNLFYSLPARIFWWMLPLAVLPSVFILFLLNYRFEVERFTPRRAI